MATSTIKKPVGQIYAGDVLNLGSTYPTYSALIASASSIEFLIPINRYINASSASFDNLYLRVWDDSGTQVVNAVDVANTSGYTLNIQIEQNSGLRVKVTNSGVNFGTAYHPALVNLRNGSRVTFS